MIMVSVIIPVYNAEEYLKECLDSVLNQTMKNQELICIDDGSTDNSLLILQDYHKIDSRVQVLMQENQGSGSARNRGLKAARGKYIAFLDADDFWYDEFALEVIINTAEKMSCNVLGSFWGYYKNGQYERSNLHREYFERGETGRWIEFKDEQNCFNYGSYLFKRKFLIDNHIFFPPYIRFQDPPFLVKALTKACSYYVIPTDWYCYRTVYKRALSTTRKTVDFVKGVLDVCEVAEKNQFWEISKDMISRINVASPYIINAIMRGNTELLVLLDKVNQYVTDKCVKLEPVLFVKDSIYNRCQMIVDEFWCRAKIMDRLIIYGAGFYGNLLLKQLERMNTDLEIVFAETEYPKVNVVEGRRCLWIDELAENKEKSFVVVAVIKETQPVLVSNIKRLGFVNYICLDTMLMTALECMG